MKITLKEAILSLGYKLYHHMIAAGKNLKRWISILWQKLWKMTEKNLEQMSSNLPNFILHGNGSTGLVDMMHASKVTWLIENQC